ncbi:MAG: (2Fe-2S)-binding protein [Fuerstiella sp.]|nr:(2Fe-2S)-binding protein [Fuerstiella sp.]
MRLGIGDAGKFEMLLEEKSSNQVVCHCLGITEREIGVAGVSGGCRTLADVKAMTAAGSGCTACHRRIIAVLRKTTVQTVTISQEMNSSFASRSSC